MPLTPKGQTILGKMAEEYGHGKVTKKVKRVFYASINAGKIKGAH